MDNHHFIYQPYRSQGFFAPILWVANCLCILALGYAIAEKAWAVSCTLGGMVLVSAWVLSLLQRQAYALVLMDTKGIVLIGDKKTVYRHIPWDALSYGYLAHNFRNFQFLILSKEPLTDKQAKALANRCSNRSQMYMDGNVGISLDPMQETEPLVDHIAQHICFPETYRSE